MRRDAGIGSQAALGGIAAIVMLSMAGMAAGGDDGYERGQLAWQGTERFYLLHVPPAAGDAALPLVIALHGAGGTGGGFAEETRFAAAADRRKMLVVFPDGTETAPGRETWNAQFCCGTAAARQVDDIGFIGALIDHLAGRHEIDRDRVYATGMSNGAMMTYQLAAAHPEWFAAIAPVAGTIGGMTREGKDFIIPLPKETVPVMIIHGRKDPYVRFDGGSSTALNFPYRWKMSVADSLSFWAAVDGCDPTAIESEPVAGKLRRIAYPNCQEGSEVLLWEIEDGAHNWPGEDVGFPAPDGKTRSAAAEILAFFAAHSRGQGAHAER